MRRQSKPFIKLWSCSVPVQKKREHFRMGIAACHGYLGDMKRIQGDLEAALACYQKAVELGSGKVITNGMGQFYSGLGQIYYLQGKEAQAEEYLEKAVSCLKRHGYYWGLERAEAYMAMLLWNEGRKRRQKPFIRIA